MLWKLSSPQVCLSANQPHTYNFKVSKVQTSSATRDLLLIQQNKFYWISNRSRVAELVSTV